MASPRLRATGDRKVEFIAFADHTLAYVRSALGYPAYYPVHPVALERPVQAVLMDLDGTSVHSEGFWIWIIERTTASLLGEPRFELEPADLPFVSGHSVSEHLTYCVRKYCPDKTVEEARDFYFEHTRREMRAILEGRGRADAFVPAPGLKEFLLELKGSRDQDRAGDLRPARESLAGDRGRVSGAGPGRPARLLRCDHHRRVSVAPR